MRAHPLVAFVALAYGWTWITVLPLLLQRRGVVQLNLPEAWEAVGAFGPLVAAWVVSRAEGGLNEFRARFAGTPDRAGLLVTYSSPLLFLLVALAVVGKPDWSILGNGELGTLHGVLDLVLVASLLQALGEEPGWRGYLLPRLRERHGPLVATLVLFPVWVLWHLPFFLSRPEFGWPQFAGFSLGILSAAFWLTWLWERTRSVWLAIAWHALINITRGVALALSTRYFLSYGLAVTVGALLIAGWWLWQGRRRTGPG